MSKVNRLIAVYLPQFHPVKENDEWWGKGFTEWTNVTKARPLFRGHYQPHLPSDLGFYDLRVSEVREQQAALARENGIYGFCYYHYWFNGKRILERPLNEVLNSGAPDFPFMICWANENWTRTWNGGDTNVLLEQKYCEEDDREHIRYLLKNVFCDPRYIRIDNKPVFCIYRSQLFPDMKRTIEIWREEANKVGTALYICRMESFGQAGDQHLESGFDAAVDFQPFSGSMKKFNDKRPFRKVANKINEYLFNRNKIKIVDYGEYVNFMCKQPLPNYKSYPCVTPMWDNSARRKKRAFIMKNSSPELYKKWLKSVIGKFVPYTKEENLIFINAWNEWAEGNHLEPDRKWGGRYLEATKEALSES